MQKENQYSPVLNRILTLQQLKEFVQLLREAHQGLYTPNGNTKEKLEEKLPYFLAETLLTMADKNAVPLTDAGKLQELIDNMRKHLESLPVAEVVVAFLPTYRQLQQLSNWWEAYVGVHVILDLKVDENIIGGTRISYNGIFKDYSLSYWIKQNAGADVEQFM